MSATVVVSVWRNVIVVTVMSHVTAWVVVVVTARKIAVAVVHRWGISLNRRPRVSVPVVSLKAGANVSATGAIRECNAPVSPMVRACLSTKGKRHQTQTNQRTEESRHEKLLLVQRGPRTKRLVALNRVSAATAVPLHSSLFCKLECLCRGAFTCRAFVMRVTSDKV